MGFFIRKRKSLGPLGLNFSTKGVGISAGVTGARISVGPNGAFVHLGRKGLYYRKKISTKKKKTPHTKQPVFEEVNFEKIDTKDLVEFKQQSNNELVNELNEKLNLFAFSDIFRYGLGAFSLLNPFFLIIFGGIALFKNQYMKPFLFGMTILFLLGFLLFSLVNPIFFIFLIVYVGLFLFTLNKDIERKTISLAYKLDKKENEEFEELNKGFEELKKSEKVWSINFSQNADWKRNGGAQSLVKKNETVFLSELPEFFESNVCPTSFKISDKTYYFFPDQLLIYQGKKVVIQDYNKIITHIEKVPFIESEFVPSDAKVINHTWQFVNQDGSPDQRFNFNKQLPVLEYSQITLSSPQGLNIQFLISNRSISNKFYLVISKYCGKKTNSKDIDILDLNEEAIELAKQENLIEAEKLFNKVLKLDSKNVDALNGLGNIAFRKGHLKDAEKHYKKVITINPNYHNAIANLGLVTGLLGNKKESMKYLDKAIKLEPQNTNGYYFKALVLEQSKNKNDLKEAIDYFRRVLEINPEDEEAMEKLTHNESKLRELY